MTIRPAALVLLSAFAVPAQANIDIRFDYSYDTSGFFSDSGRKSVLDSAAGVFESLFADQLTAITSTGANRFDAFIFNPGDPFGVDLELQNFSVAAGEIRVFVGGYDFTGGTLGLGGPGGFGCSGLGAFCSDAARRGQGATANLYDGSGNLLSADAVDFAPWGGAISFDSAGTDWHFGLDTLGLDAGMFDFYSVAVHELAHVLGFGTSDAFFNRIDSSFRFAGPASGSVAMYDEGHWALGTLSLVGGIGQEAAMTPFLTDGTRKHFTDLDVAAMHDIGWVTPIPEADTWTMLLAGLGLVGFAARRRAQVGALCR